MCVCVYIYKQTETYIDIREVSYAVELSFNQKNREYCPITIHPHTHAHTHTHTHTHIYIYICVYELY